MCRLLAVQMDEEFCILPHLEVFAIISRHSKEYQGHGWGMAYLDERNNWQHYHNVNPIWDDNLEQFKNISTNHLVVHARSAFQDKDITVENTMPFYDDNYIFTFNGQLSGVRIKEEGRIGAEKIFNFIKRFDKGDTQAMLHKGVDQIKKRTKYIKGMNIIISDKKNLYTTCNFGEQPDYFTLHYQKQMRDGKQVGIIICSDPYPESDSEEKESWEQMRNGEVRVF